MKMLSYLYSYEIWVKVWKMTLRGSENLSKLDVFFVFTIFVFVEILIFW